MAERVNVDNFVRAETARMFDANAAMAGGPNRWGHLRAPTPLDRQAVIRMNRDTLYSMALAHIGDGATVTVPDAGDRYLSVMVIDEDHHIRRIIHDPGAHHLSVAEHGTPFVLLVARIFVDPDDPADLAEVNALQDGLGLEVASDRPYTHPDHDPETLDATRELLLRLGEGLPDSRRTFGAPDEVDPVRHLIGTALGWGGLPEREAFYVIEAEPRSAGHHRVVFRDVPVDAFWSITVYDRDGYLAENPAGVFSRNGVTSTPEADGSVVIDLAPADDGYPNLLPVMDGWNYAMRFYRPRREILDGTWQAPVPEPVG